MVSNALGGPARRTRSSPELIRIRPLPDRSRHYLQNLSFEKQVVEAGMPKKSQLRSGGTGQALAVHNPSWPHGPRSSAELDAHGFGEVIHTVGSGHDQRTGSSCPGRREVRQLHLNVQAVADEAQTRIVCGKG